MYIKQKQQLNVIMVTQQHSEPIAMQQNIQVHVSPRRKTNTM